MALHITQQGTEQIIARETVREPSLLKLSNGDLLLTFHSEPDVCFAHRGCLRSSDGGQTWQPETSRGHREQASGQSSSGAVLAFDIYTFETQPGEYLGSLFRSDDGGKTFTGPHDLIVNIDRVMTLEYPTEQHMPEQGHVLRKFYIPLPEYYEPIVARSSRRIGFYFWRYAIEMNGRWLAPMVGRFHADRCNRTILVVSEDEGRTWNFLSTIAYDHEEAQDGYCEPAISVVADGSLLCVMRRGGRIPLAQSRSTDGGQTWSKPEYLAAHGVDPDLVLMSNGVLACTFGRPGRYVMFSEDGCGFGWGYRTDLGGGSGSCYMGIAEVAPGKLLLTYDRFAENIPANLTSVDECGRYNPEYHKYAYIASTEVTVSR